MQIWYSCFRYTKRLFLGCALFVTRCDIIRASWETKIERLSYREKYLEEFVWEKSLFSPFSSSVSAEWLLQRYIRVNSRKNENLSQFNTNWLPSLRMWYYFILFLASVVLIFSRSYINWKEPHIRFLFVFTKILIKSKNLQTRCW